MRLNDDCCGVMDNGFFHYMGCVQVLVGRVALIVNVAMSYTEYLDDLSTGKLSDLIKNGNNLLMIREPLIMLTPCTKPLTKVHLSELLD